jgi:hypothetical protein
MKLDCVTLPQVDLDEVNKSQITFCVEGETIWIVNTWKKFWKGVEAGELGLNPKILFSKQKTVIGEYVN